MGSGKSTGPDREYQVHVRDLVKKELQKELPRDELLPYAGDGIDVPLKACGTTVTFDVALRNGADKIFVVECKRRADSIPQKDLFAFVQEVECLQAEMPNKEVAGIFVVKHMYQIGAIRVADHLAVEIWVMADGQSSTTDFIGYDPVTGKATSRRVHYAGGTITGGGALSGWATND